MTEAPFHDLLDTPGGAAPSSRALEEVVRRHRRRRASQMRLVAVGAAVVLGGAIVGFGVSQSKHQTSTALGAKPPDSQSHGPLNAAPLLPGPTKEPAGFVYRPARTEFGTLPANSAARATSTHPAPLTATGPGLNSTLCAAYGCGSGGDVVSLHAVGRRTAGGVHVQSYLVTFSAAVTAPVFSTGRATSGTSLSLPALTPALPVCDRTSELIVGVEVDSHLAGYVAAPNVVAASSPLETVSEGVVSGASAEPVVVAVARVGPSVARVTARFSNGASDSAVPMDGWAVLVTRASSPTVAASDRVTISAEDRAGSEVGSTIVAHPGLVGFTPNACPSRTP